MKTRSLVLKLTSDKIYLQCNSCQPLMSTKSDSGGVSAQKYGVKGSPNFVMNIIYFDTNRERKNAVTQHRLRLQICRYLEKEWNKWLIGLTPEPENSLRPTGYEYEYIRKCQISDIHIRTSSILRQIFEYIQIFALY